MLRVATQLTSRCVIRASTSCALMSSVGSVRLRQFGSRERYNREERSRRNDEHSRKRSYRRYYWAGIGPFTFWQVFKHHTGIEPIQLDKDEVHAKIKECMLYRKNNEYEAALKALHEALELLEEENPPRHGKERTLTYIYLELGVTFQESKQLVEAEKVYTEALQRILHVEKQSPETPEYVLVTLRLAEVFAAKGERRMAESGFKHALQIQRTVGDRHIAHYHSWRRMRPIFGSQEQNVGNTYSNGAAVDGGQEYSIRDYCVKAATDAAAPCLHEEFAPTDPVCLLGMVLESYAYFLIEEKDKTRLQDAQELFDDAMHIASEFFGAKSQHSITMLNNMAVRCLWAQHYDLANRYLRAAIRRAEDAPDKAQMALLLPGYYCNLAEALFHQGKRDEARKCVEKALHLARQTDVKQLQEHVQQFKKSLEREMRQKWLGIW